MRVLLLVLLASALALSLASVPACPSCSGRPSVQLDELEAIATGNYVRVVSNAHARSLGVSFGPSTSAHWFTDWTRATIDASGLDHKPGFGEHNGPGRSSRAVALAVIAMYDAVVAVKGAYSAYCPGIVPASHPNADARVAIAYAAHSTLSRLFTKQTATFDSLLASSLQYVPAGAKFDEGRAVGQQAADCIWSLRLNDSSSTPEPVIGSGPGQYSPPVGPMLWQKDPISQKPAAVGAYWASVTPFALTHASQFRTAPPPAFSSPQWEADYSTVKSIGAKHSTTRTADQSLAGYYWAYDGLPSLCAPPRLYNQIAMQIAAERCLNLTETARFLAVLNVALADSGIAAWDSKYFYNLARPITGIRLNDDAVYGDQNPATVADPSWEPLGAPASNTGGVDFTPPFPAYPSGHAVFGGALFQVLRTYFGDNYPFTFVSDEYNGETKGSDGSTRPVLPRSFQTFSQAELENGASRIYLGIHWQCDCDNGIGQGNSIANYVMQNLFRKL